MNKFFRIKKTTIKMLLVNVLALILFVGFLYYIVVGEVNRDIVDNIYSNNSNYAMLMASDIDNELGNLINTMSFLAEIEQLKDFDFDSIEAIFNNVLNKNSVIDQIHVSDENGEQIYKTTYGDTLGDRSDRKYYQMAMLGKPYVSDVIISRSTSKPISVVAVPIIKDDRIIGVLSASINLAFISDKLESLIIGDESYGFIVDDYGRVIAHPRDDYVENMLNVSYLEPVQRVLEGQIGTGTYEFEGLEKMVSYRPLVNANWGILVQVPKKVAFGNVESITKKIKISFLIFIVFLILIQELILKMFISPVDEILVKLRDIKSKKKIITFEGKTKGEFGEIQNAIEDMSKEIYDSYNKLDEKVNKRTEELNEANDLLSTKFSELERAYSDLELANKKLIRMKIIESSSRLAKQVAHNLNTPLGTVLTLVSYLTRKLKNDIEHNDCNNGDYINMANMIQDSVENVIGQINDFKDIIFDGISDEKTTLDILKEIKTAENTQRLKYGFGSNDELDILIEVNGDTEIETYPKVFEFIFNQLISNSIEHGKEVDKKINISIDVEVRGKLLLIKYCDDGKGMKKENLENIFEPYFKEIMSKSNTGIGMSMIFNLLTNVLDGNIVCVSDTGMGLKCDIEVKL